jgi:hypothetical protein
MIDAIIAEIRESLAMSLEVRNLAMLEGEAHMCTNPFATGLP